MRASTIGLFGNGITGGPSCQPTTTAHTSYTIKMLFSPSTRRSTPTLRNSTKVFCALFADFYLCHVRGSTPVNTPRRSNQTYANSFIPRDRLDQTTLSGCKSLTLKYSAIVSGSPQIYPFWTCSSTKGPTPFITCKIIAAFRSCHPISTYSTT